jgi:CPA1 family monovalent cation:H+ antiporter
MVLAVSLPASFPQRDLLVTMTFGVVILSILVQGVTVGPALRWLGLTRPAHIRADYAETRAALLVAHSSLDDLERTGSMAMGDGEMRKIMAGEYDEMLGRAERELASLGAALGSAPRSAAHAARRLLRDTERQRVLDAFQAGALSAEERDRCLTELDRLSWEFEESSSP